MLDRIQNRGGIQGQIEFRRNSRSCVQIPLPTIFRVRHASDKTISDLKNWQTYITDVTDVTDITDKTISDLKKLANLYN